MRMVNRGPLSPDSRMIFSLVLSSISAARPQKAMSSLDGFAMFGRPLSVQAGSGSALLVTSGAATLLALLRKRLATFASNAFCKSEESEVSCGPVVARAGLGAEPEPGAETGGAGAEPFETGIETGVGGPEAIEPVNPIIPSKS